MRAWSNVVTVALLFGPLLGAAIPSAAAECRLPEAAEGVGLHAEWDRFVGAVARANGSVDYDCAEQLREHLDAYRTTLQNVDLSRMTRSEQIATWINAYNAFTVELILRHREEISSIRDIPRSQRWKLRAWNVGGNTVSLDQIEHDILRPEYEEPRIHFALNCASIGCPALRDEAYSGAHLDAQLDDAAQRFLTNPEKGARTGFREGWLGGETPTLWLSSIFDWFREDFEQAAGSVREYVEPYLSPDDRRFVQRHEEDLDIEHLDYDWSLNDASAPQV
jgi:hypothetical protein